jgi:hypothetical protein
VMFCGVGLMNLHHVVVTDGGRIAELDRLENGPSCYKKSNSSWKAVAGAAARPDARLTTSAGDSHFAGCALSLGHAQTPLRALHCPAGPDWIHETKHDGYRLSPAQGQAGVAPQRPQNDPQLAKITTNDSGLPRHESRHSAVSIRSRYIQAPVSTWRLPWIRNDISNCSGRSWRASKTPF